MRRQKHRKLPLREPAQIQHREPPQQKPAQAQMQVQKHRKPAQVQMHLQKLPQLPHRKIRKACRNPAW